MNWNKTSEILPEPGRRVLVCTSDGIISICSLEGRFTEYVWEDDEGCICGYEYIVAWMPLPNPINESEIL